MQRVFSNRFNVLVDDNFTRIDFADLVNGEAAPQGGIVIVNGDAKELADCILKTQAQHESKKAAKQ